MLNKLTDNKATKNVSLLPAFIVASCVTQAFLTLGVVTILFYMSSQKPPTLVELADGSTVRTKAIDAQDRDPQAIRQFVGTTLRQLFDWRCVQPANTGQHEVECSVDIGLGASSKLTLNSWQSGFALAENFRQPYLREIAKITPQNIFASGGTSQAVLLIKHVGEPQKLSPGRWKVSMISNLVIFDNGNNLGRAISVNKDVFVRSVDTPPLEPNASPLDTSIYNARKDGMEIYAMQDLKLVSN